MRRWVCPQTNLRQTRAWERIPLPDAEIHYLSRLDLGDLEDEVILNQLIAEVPWRNEFVSLWGKKMVQPRLIAWYGDAGRRYAYSGIQLDPLKWSNLLSNIKRLVERAVPTSFNSVLLNYYRDNRDSIGFHSDDEPELGGQPVIASLSLGEERTFVLKHKTSKLRPVHLQLASGSLLLMKGDTQRNWKHGIPKETRPCGPRINLTFRSILTLAS